MMESEILVLNKGTKAYPKYLKSKITILSKSLSILFLIGLIKDAAYFKFIPGGIKFG